MYGVEYSVVVGGVLGIGLIVFLGVLGVDSLL
jgi:hypothetical protein